MYGFYGATSFAEITGCDISRDLVKES